MNFMEGTVEGGGNGAGVNVTVPAIGATIPVRPRGEAPTPGTPVMVGIRPEHFTTPEDSALTFEAPVSVVEQLGGVSYLYLDVGGDTPMTVEQKGHSRVRDGERAIIGIEPGTAMMFEKSEAGLRL